MDNNETMSMDQLTSSETIDITKPAGKNDDAVIDITKPAAKPVEEASSEPMVIGAVKLNSNIKRKPLNQRSASDVKIMTVEDLDQMVPKKEEDTPRLDALREKAYSALDEMVKRKQDEYKEFIQRAEEDDRLNKERIRDGLEEEPIAELKYRVQDLSSDVTHDPHAVEEKSKDEIDNELIESDIDIAASGIINDKPVQEMITIDNHFKDETTDEVEDSVEELVKEAENEESVTDNFNPSAVTISNDFNIDEEDPADLKEEKELPIVEGPVEDDDYSDIEKEIDAEVDGVVETPAVVEEKKEDEVSLVDTNIASAITVSSKIDIPEDNKDENKSRTITGKDFDISEEDIENDVNATSSEAEDKLSDEELEKIARKSLEDLRNEIVKKVINTSRRMDLKTIAVSNNVADLKDALKAIKSNSDTTVRTASYPMMYANRNFMATSLKGPDIAMMVEADDARIENNPNILLTREQAKILYDHDANPYKPSTIESWAKTIPYGDIESMFAAVYLASLKKANYIPRQCPNERCQNSFLTDTINIADIIRFPNDTIKERFETIKNSELTKEASETYESSVSVINDRFAIGLKAPSIFTILYEYTALDNTFANKYSTMLYIMQYIDYLYLIDDDGQLNRITWKTYAGDYGRTFKSKIATYANILKEFDETDFSFILALVRSMETKNTDNNIRYFIPKTKCKKCGTTIEEEEVSPRQLVFTRQRLVALATTPLER